MLDRLLFCVIVAWLCLVLLFGCCCLLLFCVWGGVGVFGVVVWVGVEFMLMCILGLLGGLLLVVVLRWCLVFEWWAGCCLGWSWVLVLTYGY